MFIVTPFPNIVYALDLTQTGGPVKWKYEPNPQSSAQGLAWIYGENPENLRWR